LGNPECHFASVHIGGTNGKGSVAAMVASALEQSGRRVALYTSPHLVDVRERMMVDGRPISTEAFAMWTNLLSDTIVASGASFFEATTAIAFADFAARGADIGVVEVGLGGRLDSTNVLQPLVSAVTAVSIEHTDYLGDSLESIALEKAGIAKAGTRFVVGDENPSVVAVMRKRAEEQGASVTEVAPGVEYSGRVGMEGRHQRRNAAVAEAVLKVLPGDWMPGADAIEAGLAVAWLPGRFDRRGRWLFDVAHNPEAVASLVRGMRDMGVRRPVSALIGVLNDKDWSLILPTIRSEVDSLWISTPPSSPVERRSNLMQLTGLAGEGTVIEPDFDLALAEVQRDAQTILVTGSFHTVGDAMSRLPGFAPLG
jgi:dihydrofolate synthase/folylpolyglutamate synthase